MKDTLAEHLLAKVMGWNATELTQERQDLQMLSEYKYDEYQQFFPGMRFIESLSLWLDQFKDADKKTIAYNFIKKHLVFISNAELNHLIRMTFPDKIKPHLIQHAADKYGENPILINKILKKKEFSIMLRQCLFLGLSDGARTDLFRRFSELNHEQVYPTYLITEDKSKSLLDELHADLKKIVGDDSLSNEKFRIVFLIDDFSASGISYLREEDGKLAGKIQKFYDQLAKKESNIAQLFDLNDLEICVILYLSTKRALNHIREEAKKLSELQRIKINVMAVQELEDTISLKEEDIGDFLSLMKKKFDKSIINEHYEKGRHDKPHLGFDECGLPLILSHNCPNNSLPILWYESQDKGHRALFPRVQRFKVGK